MVQPGRPGRSPVTTGPPTGGPVTRGAATGGPVAASGPGRPVTASPGAGDEGDWTVQAADTIERAVGKVRDKTSVPLVTVARALVFGLLAAVMGVVAAVMVAVMLVRIIDVVTGDENVWIAHLAVGGLFAVVGAFLLRKATTTPTAR